MLIRKKLKIKRVEYRRWFNFDEGFYEGEVKLGTNLPHGRGIFIHKSTGLICEGYRKKGLRWGLGRQIEPTQHGYSIYEGKFKQNYPHGLGTLELDNGDIYKGMFRNGCIEGKGELFVESEGRAYTGSFHDGKRDDVFIVKT